MSSDVAAVGRRIEELLAGFGTPGEQDEARERAEELVRTIVTLYGEGLERLLTTVHAELGDRSSELFERICEDRLVEGLLCLHGLHPISLEDRIDQAMQSALPYIRSHHGNMELSRIDGDVVYLRLEGSCDGCAASASTLKQAVERAILERAPEIREVRAEESLLAQSSLPETSLRVVARV
jgi:Fe-S cluster biogenesis protein NfuA